LVAPPVDDDRVWIVNCRLDVVRADQYAVVDLLVDWFRGGFRFLGDQVITSSFPRLPPTIKKRDTFEAHRVQEPQKPGGVAATGVIVDDNVTALVDTRLLKKRATRILAGHHAVDIVLDLNRILPPDVGR